jgi:TolB-like protein
MIYRFAQFTLDTGKFELHRDGDLMNAEPLTISIISYLVENRHRLVTRDDLHSDVWSGRTVSDWAVSAGLKSARRALGDITMPRQFIRTIHGKGVRFIAPLVEAPEHLSLVVIPFENLSTNPEEGYFADGFSEDLITDLSRVSGLKTLSRNASFSLKVLRPDLEKLRTTFGVTHALEGSVRRQGQAIRINAQLLDLSDGQQIWADRFDGHGTDIFKAQDKIADRILTSLRLQFSLRTTKRPTHNSTAYDLCLRGRAEYFQYSPKNMARALDFFEQAGNIDPNYAEVFAYQSYCRTAMHLFAAPGSDETLEPASRLAERAIKLDPKSAVAHARLGWILGYLDRIPETIATFEQAVSLDPQNAEVIHTYGETMNRLGQPDIALPLLERAFEIEHFVPPSWEFARAHSYILQRDYSQAYDRILPVVDRVPKFLPARVQLARLYFETDQLDQAKQTVQSILKAAPRFGMLNVKRMFPYPQPNERNRLATALLNAGMTDPK